MTGYTQPDLLPFPDNYNDPADVPAAVEALARATQDGLDTCADAAGTSSALALKAPLASPTFTGAPTAPTAAAGTNTTQLATTAFVKTAVDPKAPLASPALTGTPTAPTAAAGTGTTQLATTAFVKTAVDPKAPLASPALTGTPTCPTPASTDDSTKVANTSFVKNQMAGRRTGSVYTLQAGDTQSYSVPHGLDRLPVAVVAIAVYDDSSQSIAVSITDWNATNVQVLARNLSTGPETFGICTIAI